MVLFGVYLLLLLVVVAILVCAQLNRCDSRMRMLNADWMEEAEKFRFVARWGVRL